MALEQLITVLRREAEEEAAGIRAAAAAEAAAIRDRTEAALAERRAQMLAVREGDRVAAVELALVSARQAARREILAARRRLLDRVVEAMRSRLPGALGTTEYLGTLPGQLREALHCLGTRDGTLRIHPALVDAARPLIAVRAGLTLVPDTAIGSGFLLQSADGGVEINGTLEDRLERLASRVALDVMADLEGHP